MKSQFATALAIVFHTIGFIFGATIWCLIGYGFGSLMGHPTTGILCGLAYQSAAYFALIGQMQTHLDASRQKFLTVLDRTFV